MFLRSLVIEQFRNLDPQQLQFSEKKNYLFGENAQGKTNLLEAIYLLCLCKSFRTASDAEMIPLGKVNFQITGLFLDSSKIEHEISFRYQAATGKQVILDGKPVHHLSSLVGQFPVVVLSVADYDITHGPPQQRRRFINILASQCSARYLNDLKEYEKIIKQRNRVLWLIQNGKSKAKEELEVWNEQLISRGMALILFRSKLASEIAAVIQEYYQTIARNGTERLSIHYQPNIENPGDGDMHKRFCEKLTRMRSAEIARATSLVGPHRDEFIFMLGESALRQFGSRGEHKSALISLKAAELSMLKKHLNITPLLLLDDLYAELDQARGEKVMELFAEEGQCFITGTSSDYESLRYHFARKNLERLFFVSGGRIEENKVGQ
jgi:DNA replication and repair protein RecF